jgi:glycosyltransferase involved in cell wall biosynthesis
MLTSTPTPTPTDTASPTASVVVCAFADERLELTVRCVAAVTTQDPVPLEVIVIVDHNPTLQAALSERLGSGARVVANAGERGLSSARNTAIALARGELVVFLDDDARPRPGWLAGLLAGFAVPAVVGLGGPAIPEWEDAQPGWFPDSFLWVVGCSYTGQPKSGAVRNPIGANMAFRREVFDEAGLFDTQIGRLGSLPLGCEETEICIRAARHIPGAEIVLVPDAAIDHWVPQLRGTPRYLLRRCYYEGISKALVRTLGDTRTLETERDYVTRTLTLEVARAAGRLITGPDRGAAGGRIAAVIGGLSAAALGYARGSVMFRNR